MAFRKVEGETWESGRCKHPEHRPPAMRVLAPGLWEWTCPGCGAVEVVHVKTAEMTADAWKLVPRSYR